MSTQKTPGQKRKFYIKAFCVTLFVVVTIFIGIINKNRGDAEYAWANSPVKVDGLITSVSQQDESYRTLKGRKRERTSYYAEYTFSVGGSEYGKSSKIDSSAWYTLDKGSSVEVWHAVDRPEVHELSSVVASELASSHLLNHLFSIAPFSAMVMFILHSFLSLFVRESSKALPEGFFRDDSWLDVDDKYLVFIDDRSLVWFHIDKKKVGKIQSQYQKGVSYNDLTVLAEPSTIYQVHLDEVTEVISARNHDILKLQVADKWYSVEFLNQAVKAHALERILPMLPGRPNHRVEEKSRVSSAMPAMITLCLLLGVVLWMNSFVVNVLAGLVAVAWVLPRVVSRLVTPTVTDNWLVGKTNSESQEQVFEKTDHSRFSEKCT